MGHGAEFPQIEIPAVVFGGDPFFSHLLKQHLVSFFPLRPADNLADPRHQNVHGRHRPRIVVHSHVKRFERTGKIDHGNRLVKQFFSQIALVFRLQIIPPFHGEGEGFARAFEQADRLRVGKHLEGTVQSAVQGLDEGRFNETREEFKVFAAIGQDRGNQVLHEGLRQVEIVLQVRKSHFRFDHPEFRQVSAGI